MLVLLALVALTSVQAQSQNQPLPNTFPHNYPGIPNADYNFTNSTAWQDYYLVNTLFPNQTFPMPRSFAGNIPVNRQGHPNDTLFFWAFEKTNGSLTRTPYNCTHDPWMIWLNGGPGASSMLGLLFENGPVHIASDYSLVENKFGWNTVADIVYVDQPVGVGHSTADSTGYISSEDQMGEDFLEFLANMATVFPCLSTRPLYLMGESYAGTYIPYITKSYFSSNNPPVNLTKIAMGDPTTADEPLFEDYPVLSILETYPQLIDYDSDVYKYFKEQRHLCGYDLNLTYPQNEYFPTLRPNQLNTGGTALSAPRTLTKEAFRSSISRLSKSSSSLSKRELALRAEKKASWKRDLSQRPNGTIDQFYQCFLLFEALDYAVNFTKPWSINDPFNGEPGFDVYSIPDALNPEAPQNASVFLNDPATRAALHAPLSKNWTAIFRYPFDNNSTNFLNPGTNPFGDPSIPPMAFLTDLATNSSKHNISWVFYSGNDDFLVAHQGTEATIQNMTFGGIQGFTQAPSTAWYGDDGQFAGIVHQERNITYVLFDKAGHLVPQWQPERTLTFVREFVIGSNPNGTVVNNRTVGVNFPLKNDILPGEHNPIFTGSGTTMGSTIWPSATIAAWDSFIATGAASATAPLPTSTQTQSGAVSRMATAGVAVEVASLAALLLAH